MERWNNKQKVRIRSQIIMQRRHSLPTDSIPNKWGRYKSLFPME